MRKKVMDLAEKFTFWLVSNLVGIAFLLLGVLATFSISENVADTCNIWSLFYILGLWIAYHIDLYGKVAQLFKPKDIKKSRAGWKFTIELTWMLASMLIASSISNWLWVDRTPEMLGLTTNGCSLFVMGITSFMLYLSYTE